MHASMKSIYITSSLSLHSTEPSESREIPDIKEELQSLILRGIDSEIELGSVLQSFYHRDV